MSLLRQRVITHYKDFFGIEKLDENHADDIDWGENLIEKFSNDNK